MALSPPMSNTRSAPAGPHSAARARLKTSAEHGSQDDVLSDALGIHRRDRRRQRQLSRHELPARRQPRITVGVNKIYGVHHVSEPRKQAMVHCTLAVAVKGQGPEHLQLICNTSAEAEIRCCSTAQLHWARWRTPPKHSRMAAFPADGLQRLPARCHEFIQTVLQTGTVPEHK